MDAIILLADAAQTSPEGKLHVLGLGWTTTTTPLPPSALALLIRVPWDRANDQHTAVIELLSADGQAVTIPGPLGPQPMRVEAEFETGRPPGIPKGTPLDMPLSFNIGAGLPLLPGRYEWRLTINDETRDNWHADFYVRPPAAGAPGVTT